MSESSSEPVAASTAPAAAPIDAAQAEAAEASGGASFGTTVSSLNELQKKAPQLFHQMMIGIATAMVGQMKKQQDRLTAMWQKARNNQP